MTILVIDDEKIIGETTTLLLNHLGYKTILTNNGLSGLNIFSEKKNEIELIILDMIMPDVSGGETFDKLREINPNIKVILSSGYSIEDGATEIINRGCNGFIQKPYRMGELSTKIKEILEG